MIDLRLLPPGFGFHPTDEELVVHYLKGKVHDQNEEQFEIISVIDLYKYEPWDLPGKCVVPSRDGKWHFFSRRDRKYPNGARKNRATEKGYWKATGKDRNIRSAKRVVGTKKTLVFHEGRASNGKRTDWVMHEYHLDEKECSGLPAGMHESYALCRICKKNGFDLQEDAAAETEVTDPSPKEAESNCLCSPKLEGSPGTVGEITPVGPPPLGGLFEVWLKGSSSTGTEEVSTSVVQTHETQSEVCPPQHLEEGAAETEEDVEMWLNPIVDYQPDQWGQTSEGWLYSTPGPMAATVPLQSSEIVLGDNFQPPKPECFVAAANQEFPVAYQYQEAESSIHGKLGRPYQVPAENSETDVNVEALLAEMYKAEDSVAAADQEFPVGYEYQEAESRFHDELVRPDQIPAENSETDVNVEALLAELYKAEDSVAAVDQEFPVGYEYQEAESSFHGELARPDQVPAENSEIDVNVESLLAELYKAEDSVAAVDQEFPVGYEYQESESGFHGELVRPDQVPVENSETDLNEEDLLAELYMAATGMRLRLNSYPASDGVSLSDLGVHEEPATNETGVQIRRRHLELPEEFISQGPRIIMQVYKMESAATGAVKTCTFEDQTVSVREHDDSNYKPGEKKPFPLENSSKKSSIQIGELHVLKNSSSSSELPNSVCKLTPAKVIASDVLQSEANACTVSTTVKSISGTPGSSKTGGSSFFSGTIRTWLSPSSRTKEAVADTAAVDCEQASGGGCSFMFHLRRYVSTGLCWVLPAFCVLGTSLHCY